MPHAALQKQDQKSSFQVKPRQIEMESRASRRPQSPEVTYHRNIGNMAVQRLTANQDQLQNTPAGGFSGMETPGGTAQLHDYTYATNKIEHSQSRYNDTGISNEYQIIQASKTSPIQTKLKFYKNEPEWDKIQRIKSYLDKHRNYLYSSSIEYVNDVLKLEGYIKQYASGTKTWPQILEQFRVVESYEYYDKIPQHHNRTQGGAA